MGYIKLTTPLTKEKIENLHSGDKVLLTGIIYTGRDAAHKKFIETLEKGEKLPFDINGTVIYYVGPTPEKPGEVIGSAGPTTSYRMDDYAPRLIKIGLMGMIGKGKRDKNVVDACVSFGSIYFGTYKGDNAKIVLQIFSVINSSLASSLNHLLYSSFSVWSLIFAFSNSRLCIAKSSI